MCRLLSIYTKQHIPIGQSISHDSLEKEPRFIFKKMTLHNSLNIFKHRNIGVGKREGISANIGFRNSQLKIV